MKKYGKIYEKKKTQKKLRNSKIIFDLSRLFQAIFNTVINAP